MPSPRLSLAFQSLRVDMHATGVRARPLQCWVFDNRSHKNAGSSSLDTRENVSTSWLGNQAKRSHMPFICGGSRFTQTTLEVSICKTESLFRSLQTCFSLCSPSQGKTNSSKIWSQTAPHVDVYTARIVSRHTYKQSGPTFRFNGAPRLELRDLPGAIACTQSPVPESVRAAEYFARLPQSIDRNISGITL